MLRFLPHALALAALTLPSCTSVTTTEVTELQSVCVSEGNGSDGQTTTLAVNVEFSTCLSSSCDTLVESSCEAVVSGDVLDVTGLAIIDSESGACTADCGLVTAQCVLEIDNGIYTVRSGAIEFEYEVGIGTGAACSHGS